MIQINRQPSDRHLRVFAIGQTLVIGFLAASLLRRGVSPVSCFSVVGLSWVVGVAGAIRPQLVRPFYVAWMLALFPVGWCVSHLLLAAIYGFVVTPLGLLLRCVGHDPLTRRRDPQRKTYWIPRQGRPPASRYFRQF